MYTIKYIERISIDCDYNRAAFKSSLTTQFYLID